ncbi:hypothetical protein ACR8AL_15260 [Clavibacter sepedonicus]|uniref:Uncharacterized protein n=2 Tax=Clavibacter sepedonicus TaxID=31964 RepID=B0RGL3_CLASE|nr:MULTISPECIES: hypothetical protein [Clavibacter]MBD5381353.1 hypothetical protein [Clavibacter sp.]OQJ48012.1 hypothetical protein B5P19_06745 [Clavibacter sepedonicus]OQJ53566.1 hypothetical protein B5P20_04995 [Clavibacter sepedonicus]CAQ02420.1 hypothetical protein CMS2334 [Clavibacter sepedonicus]
MRAPLLDPSTGGSRPRTPRIAFAGDAIPALDDLRALDAGVVRTHAGLERTRGADVAVTGILASGCVTPRLLTNRVADLVRHPIAAPRIAVEWADIRDRRIRDVALEAWC